MQTFLPYADFRQSAEVLDWMRLSEQRVDNLQILTLLACRTRALRNHPAVLMWNGYEHILVEYQKAICEAWSEFRGVIDDCWTNTMIIYGLGSFEPAGDIPAWLGNEGFHNSHQSELIRQDRNHYGHFFPGMPDDLPLIWPVEKEKQ